MFCVNDDRQVLRLCTDKRKQTHRRDAKSAKKNNWPPIYTDKRKTEAKKIKDYLTQRHRAH